MILLLFLSGGQRTLKPDGGYINCGIKTVFFSLLDYSVAGFERGIGELELNGYLCSNVDILDLFCLKYLHHDDILVSKAAVINEIVLPLEGMTLILQCVCQ